MAVPQRTLTLLRRLARHNGGIIDATVQNITTSWLQAWDDLGPAWQQAITAIVDQYTKTGVWPAPWQVTRIEAIARAAQSTEQSLTRLLTDAAGRVSAAAGEVSEATLVAEPSLIASQTSKASAAELEVPARRAEVELDARRARIAALFRPVGASVMSAIRWEFTHPPDTGRRPLSGLRGRVKAGFTAGLTRATTIAQTEAIDTYRTTAGLVHAANPDVVTSWCWICQLDLKACLSCWSMHGTTQPLDEPGPSSHPSCRCMRLPLAGTTAPPSAETRFRRLSRRNQISILGPARYEMWRSGDVSWPDLAIRRSNPGWRDSYTPRPVADLQRLADLSTR